MWDALFLKLAHCSDKRREAIGFPELFRQLRAYLPKGHELLGKVKEHEQRIHEMEPQKKVSNWRHQLLAHYTIHGSFDDFYKTNLCSLEEIESLISKYDEILHTYSLPLLEQVFVVKDLGVQAAKGVDRFISCMKNESE